jgi:rod shape-determining protein MreC
VNLKRYRDSIIVLLALAVPFWFLRVNMKSPARQASALDRIVVSLSAPIQHVAEVLAHGLSSVFSDYVWLVDVKENNRTLTSQNARLAERVRKLEPLEDENRRLRKLLELKQSLPVDVVSAQVIAKNTNEFFRVTRVELDRKAHDVRFGLPVIARDGVVGTTLRNAGDTFDVRLIADAGSAVDVVVQRTGARGLVRGTGDVKRYVCKIQYMERTDEVEVGDLLVTSGVGRSFPRGIPVATVTQVVKRDFGVYQEVHATPTVDFSRLEEVLIVISPAPEETTGREAPKK